MHLTGLTVCIDFADFLAETLPRNRHLFNQYVVVTSPEDTATQRLAEANACKLVCSTRYRELGEFNKGAAINDGLDVCGVLDWVCHLDADILLPDVFRQWMVDAQKHVKYPEHLDETIIGMHRWRCLGRASLLEYLCTGRHDWHVEKLRVHDQVPAGYVQAWHAAAMPVRYPEQWPTASMSDLLFAEQFTYRFHPDQPRVIHLETKKNWNADYSGRKSPRWQ